ncbi:MAG: hypothetical protein CFE24_00225 [Flavobacterium sp. BFFFF2]|nr:MAG: hypothetical protein CFE24_00225 [Flavobacterium sp. BFFFF2]
MLRELNKEEYYAIFKSSKNPFLIKEFININEHKVDKLLFLVENEEKPSIGIVLGVRNDSLHSPFSAPFGGLHYAHENIYVSKVNQFVMDLFNFISVNNYEKFSLTMPPSIYGCSFNAKVINCMYRNGFSIDTLELTSFIRLDEFENKFTTKSSREYYRQAQRNVLVFKMVQDLSEKQLIVQLIKENRERSNRLLRMTLEDFISLEKIWQVDYAAVYDENQNMVAAAIFYIFPDNPIVYTAIWGDSLDGRPLRAMDFLSYECWSYYKAINKKFIDLGISTESGGVPNEGLLRFKETHEANTELRLIISLNN